MNFSTKDYKAKADKITSKEENQYALYIGRWQPWHEGHRWLIDQQLNLKKRVCIAIRDVASDEQNPFPPEQVKKDLEEKYLKELVDEKKVKVIIIPDISSVNYGRGVGYDIIEHAPPDEIASISATKIRAKLRQQKNEQEQH